MKKLTPQYFIKKTASPVISPTIQDLLKILKTYNINYLYIFDLTKATRIVGKLKRLQTQKAQKKGNGIEDLCSRFIIRHYGFKKWN